MPRSDKVFEKDLQRAIMARLREARLLLGSGVFEAWHIPNEGNRGMGGQAEAIRQGLTRCREMFDAQIGGKMKWV